MKNIIVIDDEQYICNIIREALDEFNDYEVHNFVDPQMASEFIANNAVDLVLTDLVMGDFSGEKILDITLANHKDAIVVLMTGYPTVKTAISVMKKGGYDYLIKPFKLEDLKATIQRGLNHQQLRRENVELRSQLELSRVTGAIANGIKLQPLLNLVVDAAARILPARGASVILLDARSGRYILQCQSLIGNDASVAAFLKGDLSLCHIDFESREPGLFKEEILDNGKTVRRSYISLPLVSSGEIIGLLNTVYEDRFRSANPGQIRLLSLMGATVAAAIERNNLDRNLKKSYLMTIKALANAIEARDHYTAGHTDRVYRLARKIARRMGWNTIRMAHLKTGCILHDIGKIGVPDAILNKPDTLTDNEQVIMRRHPELGAKILGGIPFLEPVLPYILSHHERFDGEGYPQGLKGEDIPIEGRLLAVIDTFDAILSDRPYRPGRDARVALDELQKNSGTQFDPMIVILMKP